MDYSWHVQHLLREFGCGPLADFRSIFDWKDTSREATVSVRVTSDLPEFNWLRVQEEASAVLGGVPVGLAPDKPFSQTATGGWRKAEWMEGNEMQQSVAPLSRCP